MKWIIKFIVIAIAMLVAAHFVPGIEVASFWPTAIIASAVLALLNLILKPILVILTLPVNLLTLGLFTFVLNALIFWLLNFIDGVSIDGFFAALLGSLIVTAAKWLMDLIFK